MPRPHPIVPPFVPPPTPVPRRPLPPKVLTQQFVVQSWYWFVGGDQTQVYSSASGTFVPIADPTYVAWLAAGNTPTNIDSTANLGGVIATASAPRPVDANVLDGFLNTQLGAIDKVQFKILFNHENRIRTLEARPPVTVPQFLAVIKGLL